MYDIIDKVIVITGGANGIGKCLVQEFLKEKAKYVAFIDIDDVAGKEFEKEIELKYGNGKAKFFKCDVTKLNQLYDVFDEIAKENEYIDIVVNNAGIAVESPEMFVKEIEVNFTSVVSSSLKALEIMRVDHGGKGGTIINISSIAALSRNIGHLHIYAATKKAILCFSNRIGETHYPRTNVRVMTTCFGLTDTQLVRNCVEFDEIANENIEQLAAFISNKNVFQRYEHIHAEDVAKGVVECYKVGKSGSTWLINKEVLEITDKVIEADDILAANIVM
ncbi:15-hydroxyprostaglandin dehydrogenase [NAD(+)]-like [Melitaea cinxia]|uniref:15-hydroxyprostaglandin dehydrogenase [NAD(+)]-like n=1 Tax=Melitaea cinxia TaxID=113334 RepID=UPI001E27355D|nr:15-hydroxyprostaglandin dehydrogenase [NAD(+)]-like [Melitaea cinxia]